MAHRGADNDHRSQSRRLGDDIGDGLLRIREQAVLPEEVGAGVAGDAQLREDDHGGSLFCKLPAEFHDLPGIRRRVGHVYARHCSRHTNETKAVHRCKYKFFYLYCEIRASFLHCFLSIGEGSAPGMTASVACIGNVGPGFGDVGSMANYAHIPARLKITGMLEMFLGRLPSAEKS